MAIQNSRARKARRNTMEQEAIVHTSMNGAEKDVVLAGGIKGNGEASVALSALKERREKMIQGLNSVRAQKESCLQQLKDLETSVARTEGAVIALNSLISELDPQEAQQMGMGG